MDYTHHITSQLGSMMLASDGSAIVGLWFEGQKYYADTLSEHHTEKRLPVFDEAERWLEVYFSGKAPDFTPKLRLRTNAFRRAVWEILLTIPYGQTMTYGQIADQLKATMGLEQMSAQAVGGAIAHNAISLIIPCHRVIGADGSLTGYAGGIERKFRLLQMEQADMSRLYVPKEKASR